MDIFEFYPPWLKSNRVLLLTCLFLYVCMYDPVWLGVSYLGLAVKSWRSEYKQTWVKDATGISYYVDEVIGYLPRSWSLKSN